MKYRKLGKTDWLVSEIGLGTWALGGNGYGPTNDQQSKKVIEKALDRGVNFIDTADSYGNGHSEDLIGHILARRKDRDTIIATKFGWDFYNQSGIKSNLTNKYIEFAVNQSLKRLKRDWIDLYQIHNPNPKKIDEDNVYETLDNLKKAGKIRSYGISINYVDDGLKAIESQKVDTIQVSYSILNQQTAKKILSFARNHNLGIIIKEPLFSGLLSGKYNANSKFHKQDHRNGWKKQFIEQNIRRVNKLKFLVNKDRTMAQSSLSFVLLEKSVSTVIPGAKTTDQLDENINAIYMDLNQDEINEIKRLNDTDFH